MNTTITQFNMDTLIAEIKNEIIAQYKDWDGEDIDDFKYYYGNHDNSTYYYDFKIEYNMVLPCIDYITNCIEENGMDCDISVMKRVSSYEGLKGMVLYWVMNSIDFDKYKEGYYDCVNCHSSNYICFEELEGKDWVCEKCSTANTAN